MNWIIPENWERFQHYGYYRRPPWIKNYTMLLHKDEYLDLSLAARGLLHGIWLAYADRDGLVRASDINAILQTSARVNTLESLSNAGLIVVSASKPLSLSTKEEQPPPKRSQPTNIRATATKKRDSLHHELIEQAQQIAASWNGGGSDIFDSKISLLEREYHSRLSHGEREDLWDRVLAMQPKPPTLEGR